MSIEIYQKRTKEIYQKRNKSKSCQGNIKVDAQVVVNVTESEEESSISGDDNILDNSISITTSNNVLEIKAHRSFSTKQKITCAIAIKKLKQLELSGAVSSDCTAKKNVNDDINLYVSGSSTLKSSLLKKRLTVQGSGNSHIILEGTVSNQYLGLSGSSKYNAQDLQSTHIDCDVSGNSKAYIQASSNDTGNTKLKIEGSSTLQGTINCTNKDVTVNASGNSHITLEGAVSNQYLGLSGSSKYNAQDLKSKQTHCTLL